MKFANPAKSLDPVSRGKISEEFACTTSALDGHGKLNEIRDHVWLGHLLTILTAGGGSAE